MKLAFERNVIKNLEIPDIHILCLCKPTYVCILGELAGGGSIAVAVGVSDR